MLLDRPSLVVVGTGIKTVSHLTLEACGYIRESDLVCYLVNEPVMQAWIEKESKASQSLDSLYRQSEDRLKNYQSITDYILETVNKVKTLCIALYGHPVFVAKPALDAVIRAREVGIKATICPGVSAEDCLFTEFAFDPGTFGCQSYEATDFLQSRRIFDPRSHLILWQVGFIGIKTQADQINEFTKKETLLLLKQYLSKSYPSSQTVYSYIAGIYPGQSSQIIETTLADLQNLSLSTLSTLYIPPIELTS